MSGNLETISLFAYVLLNPIQISLVILFNTRKISTLLENTKQNKLASVVKM